MIQKMVTFTVDLLFLLLILQLAVSLSQSKMEEDEYSDYIITRAPSTTASTIYNDRVSFHKCQEYIGHYATQVKNTDDYNDYYSDDETKMTTKIPADIETTTENLEISTFLEETGIKNIVHMTEEIRTCPEKIREATNINKTSEQENATMLENTNYVTPITKVPATNMKDTFEEITSYTEEEEETTDTDIGTENLHADIFPPSASVIAGGEIASVGEFPHMAAIGWVNTDGSYAFDCGGTLISPRFVLTAAHCTHSHAAENPIPRVVRLGDQNIDSSEEDEADPVQVNIKAIYNHPQYTRKKNYNDIALLELEVDISFNRNIEPACLWSSREFDLHTLAIATGWGVVDPFTGKRSNELQKVILSLLSNKICDKLLLNLINRKWDKGFLDTQLCAGEIGGGKDTCQGDSGSPLQISSRQNSHKYFVIGITSFGPKFCAQLPAVYTRVSSYIDWIESVVWPDEYRTWLNSSIH